jgi:sigma-E factor negative regulatory protein RseC
MAEPVEGFAKVVAVEGEVAWLEPEPGAACGGCAAKAGCGTAYLRPAKGDRRFAVANDFRARVGDRVVVGIDQGALTRASAVAYVIPILLVVAMAVAASLLGASDAGTAAASVVGLVAGIALAQVAARRLAARGDLTPMVLRKAGTAESCAPDQRS